MWINSPPYPSVPAAQDLTWASNSLSEASHGLLVEWEAFAIEYLAAAMEAGCLDQALCGRTCEPSTAGRGVESWIPSLLATRASHSATPAGAVDQMILAIFGPTSIESLAKWNRHSYFSKTCPATSASDLTRLPPTLKAWATKLRRDSLLRRKSALATSENGCSSSPWSTPVDMSKGGST